MKIKEILSPEEINLLLPKSDFRGWITVFINYFILLVGFALMALVPDPLSFVLSLIIIGGRQHGLGVLMHDCSHHALFKSKKLNEWVGEWLCASPLLADFKTYRQIHLTHHKKTGTNLDPDLGNYKNYPVSKASLKRKIFRDLTGQTGLKFLAFVLLKRQDSLNSSNQKNNLFKPAIAQLILFLILTISGYPWLYLLWVASYLTTYMLFLRIRQIAEHAATPDLTSLDPRKNTRTTYANWLARLTVAPNKVNYHLEHHLLINVPPYNLKKFHNMLKEKNFYHDITLGKNYFQVLKLASASPNT